MNQLFPEQQLLSQLATGSSKAASVIYRQHYPTITKWLRGQGLTDEAAAADIFQEAMVVLYEKSGNPDFQLNCRIGTYLFAVARNLWYKRLQQQKRSPLELPDNAGGEEGPDWAADNDLDIHLERELHYEQLAQALEQLGEPCRSLLTAFYHQDKSMAQIATEFGYTNPDNAKTQKYKCLTRLKKIFFGTGAKKG